MSNPAAEHPEDVMSMDWVKLDALRIPDYQRPERQNIDKMVQAWSLRKAGAIIVSERAGAYWTVDGQTRAKAARRLGYEHLLAVVHFGLDEAGEAELFLALNRDRLQVSAIARHVAEVFAKDLRAIAIDDVLAQHRLAAAHGSAEGFYRFHAIVAAEHVYDEGGPGLLNMTLHILQEAFPGDSGRFRGKLVQGLGYFLARDPWEATAERVTTALARVTIHDLNVKATHWQAVAGASNSGTGSPIHMAKGIASVVYRNRAMEWKPKRPK